MTEDDPLPPEARSALDAYQAMSASKSEYFGLLQQLDVKYKERGSPTIAENLKLEKLLQTHGEKVASFNNAMQAVTDKTARELLLKKLMTTSAPQAAE
jgi:hypothetical protein